MHICIGFKKRLRGLIRFDGHVSRINLTEFRYVAARNASPEAADAYIADLRRICSRLIKQKTAFI